MKESSNWLNNLSILLLNCLLISENIKEIVSSRTSGLYADNGYQTIIHRTATQREKRELQEQILDFLDLPDRPTNTIGKLPPIKNSASEFLIDVYKNVLGENDDDEKPVASMYYKYKTDSEFNLTGQDLRAIDQSDVIMTFAAHSQFYSFYYYYYYFIFHLIIAGKLFIGI